MSDKFGLVAARSILDELIEWLYSDDMADKYLTKNEKGELILRNPPATLDEYDIETVANYIIVAIEQAQVSLSKNNILNHFNDNELVLKYIKGILSNVGFRTKEFGRFRQKLEVPETKLDPTSITNKKNINNPNILTNIAYYVSNPEQPIRLYDKLPTKSELTKNIKDYYNEKLENLENSIAVKEKELKELLARTDLTDKEKDEQNKKLEEEIAQLKAERDKARKGFQIAKDNVEDATKKINDIHTLITQDERKILDDIARRYGYDPSFKENLRKTREELKAPPYNLDDNQINYIITKASDDYAHMRKMMESNPDMFDRDMSQDTIQKENEQFQSKLRQQNLRYILPKFIERREKLVENTLNPELLKGAFAI